MSRPSWDSIWMRFALSLADRSVDPKFKVGCVVVSSDNTQVFAVGYNGDHAGGPNERDSQETGQSGFIHAEINALIKCDYNAHKQKKMYLSWSPCRVCAKAIVNAGVQEVIYDQLYTDDTTGLTLLRQAGVRVRKFGVAENS